MLRVLPMMLLLAGPALAQPAPQSPSPPADAAAPAPQTRTCLPLAQIRDSNVVDGKTIDFHMRDGSVWRNRLPYSCPGLGIERAFSYSTSIPQLCHVDVITVVVQSGPRLPGATCGLGMFERLPPKPAKPAKP